MTKKIAVITGVTGQTGSYMAELLLEKEYEVIGVRRRTSTPNFRNLEKVIENPSLTLHEADITDFSAMFDIFYSIRGGDVEVYNFAAQSHVKTSFNNPIYTLNVTGVAVTTILEAIRKSDLKCKFYQSSSSEMFGNSSDKPQNENTVFRPVSPYGVAKLMAHNATLSYRQAYGMHTVAGILHNHESPRRSENFVTRKITNSLCKIRHLKDAKKPFAKLKLGNLSAKRDFGYAKEYAEVIWMLMQQEVPKEYVIGTGIAKSVEDILDYCCELLKLDKEEVAEVDNKFKRASEIDYLCGDASLIKKDLGWEARYKWDDVISEMVTHDMRETQYVLA